MTMTGRRAPELVAAVLAAVAWAVTVAAQVRTPAAGADPAPLAGVWQPKVLVAGLVAWTAMAAAMMLPAALPAARHVGEQSFRWRRHRAIATFLGAYVAVWAAFGALALAAVTAWQAWGAAGVAASADHAVVVALAVAVVWQLTPWRRTLVRGCQKSIPLAPRGWAATRSCLHFGARYGTRCVGTCWALMLVMATATRGQLLWAVALTGAVLAERFVEGLRRRPHVFAGAWVAAAVAVVLTLPPGRSAGDVTYFCSIPLG